MTDRTPPPVHLHIGDATLATGSAAAYDHVDPATGTVNAQIPMADAADVDRAAIAAHEAFDSWRRTTPQERRALLHRLADLIDANADEFGRRAALDNGTPAQAAAAGVAAAAEWTRYYAGWADKLTGEVQGDPLSEGEFAYSLAQPYGVIGIIITWNGPLISLSMKIPAAVAAGNTVVVKPSEMTPFAPELFAELVKEAGFPPGVINILPGTAEAGAQLVTHDLVKKVSFTGGPVTAAKILQACAPSMKPAVLELGGKSANIVFDDADPAAVCPPRRDDVRRPADRPGLRLPDPIARAGVDIRPDRRGGRRGGPGPSSPATRSTWTPFPGPSSTRPPPIGSWV
ncbi:aldehyde dehydrogenase family protein [Gordonia humi]|uniref:aldehyde dehydrogenase family protein n=1 Tax=Gordonia humi TaxID=686429 RepID=UPI00361EABF9